MNRQQVINEARQWLGTRFKHQGRLKQIGVDCAGLIVGTAQNCGYKNVEDIKDYGHSPDSFTFVNKVKEQMEQIEFKDIKVADVMFFAFETEPQHVSIVTSINPLKMIHSFSVARKVVEHDVDEVWINRFKKSGSLCFRFKNIED